MRGWKGRFGTALAADGRTEAYARQMVRGLARQKRCRIFEMTFEDQPIASLIVFGSGGEHVTWKIAHDEAFSDYSPGAQVMLHATSALRGGSDFQSIDSLAYADHPMIDHLWKQRQPMGDLAIGLASGTAGRVDRFTRAKNRLDWMRNLARRVRNAFRRGL